MRWMGRWWWVRCRRVLEVDENMKSRLTIILVAIAFCAAKAQDSQFPAGIVFGPLAAFQISAPDGWVLDNKAGISNGLHCVLYLENSTWEQSAVIMYGKIAGPNFKTVEAFTDYTYKEFKKEDPKFVREKLKDVTIDKTYKAIVYKYVGGPYKSYEGAAYVQVDGAVCFVVFSAQNEEDYNAYAKALIQTIESFKYRPDYIGYQPN